jgi:hypothetical protein
MESKGSQWQARQPIYEVPDYEVDVLLQYSSE